MFSEVIYKNPNHLSGDFDDDSELESSEYYYCPYCGAILDTQVGFNPELDYWVCLECSQYLYGDVYEGERFPGVMWFCDKCESFLNIQQAFSDINDNWICTKCGYNSKLDIIIDMPNIMIGSDIDD